MRTSLFLSGLFAVSLFGTAALAEKPRAEKPAREPKAVQILRSHGDVVDKLNKADKPGAKAAQAQQKQAHQGKSPIDKGASRINCAENDTSCGSVTRGKDPGTAAMAGVSDANANRSVKWPGFMDKILGSDRMVCNEAEECHMAHAAVNRAWSKAAARNAGSAGNTNAMTKQQIVPRQMQQASAERMSCNEAEDCTMSSKGATKQWAYAAIKAGTWKPADKADDKNKKH